MGNCAIHARGIRARKICANGSSPTAIKIQAITESLYCTANAFGSYSERAGTEAFVERGDNERKCAHARTRAEEVMQFPKKLIQLFNRPLTKQRYTRFSSTLISG